MKAPGKSFVVDLTFNPDEPPPHMVGRPISEAIAAELATAIREAAEGRDIRLHEQTFGVRAMIYLDNPTNNIASNQ